jgi:hypothetical protein
LPPVDNSPALNTGKAGRTYPLKWRCIDAAGRYVRDLLSVRSITAFTINCGSLSHDSVDALEMSTPGATELRYSAGDEQFIFNWQTPNAPGTRCYRVVLTLDDGTTHMADFRLKP